MKYKIGLLIILFPVLAHAQKISPPGPQERDSLIRNVMKELKESWTLGVDSNSNTVDIGAYNKYKKLFEINALVFDDLNFRYYPGKASGNYKIDPAIKTFDEYTHDVALEVKRLEVADDTTTNFPFKIIHSSDSVILEITRSVYVEKPAKYVLKNIDALADSIRHYHTDINFEKKKNKSDDSLLMNHLKEKIKSNPESIYKFRSASTLRLTLIYTNDSDNLLKITRIENFGNTVDCINDDDKDGVLNASDSSKSFGAFTSHGETDDDLDGFSNARDRCGKTFGLQNSGCPDSYFLTNTKLDGSIHGLAHWVRCTRSIGRRPVFLRCGDGAEASCLRG